MSRAMSRAEAAGSIIMPTASKVPSAWNPPTRLRTTRVRKMICVGPPARPTEARKAGVDRLHHQRPVEQSKTNQGQGRDRGQQEERRVVKSEHTAKRRWRRSMFEPRREITVTPSANEMR